VAILLLFRNTERFLTYISHTNLKKARCQLSRSIPFCLRWRRII